MRPIAAACVLSALLAAHARPAAQSIAVRGPYPAVVRTGEAAAVVVVVDGADAPVFGALPAVDGLALDAEPARTERRFTCVAGRMVEQPTTLWPIRVVAQRPGSFTVPPLTATVAGTTLSTPTLRLEALAEPAPSPDAFVALHADRTRAFLHEPITVRIRFGFTRAFAAEHLVPMFARPLQVQAQLRASFCAGLPHAVVSGGNAAPATGVTFALDEAVAHATPLGEVEHDGRTFVAYEITRVLLPTHAGALEVPGPGLRYAWATRFTEDFVQGRVAADRREGCAQAESLTLQVDPWPLDGQPPEFTGAVGRFTVDAEVEPRRLAVGETCRLTVKIAGDGDLTRFAAPALASPDFHVLGKVEQVDARARTIRYDLRPVRAGATLPPIGFAFFDPASPAGYRRVESGPIALEVVGGSGTETVAEPAPRRVPGVDDVFDLGSTSAARGSGPARLSGGLLAGALAAPWVLFAALAWFHRRRERARLDPLGERARRAAATFAARVAAPDADTGDAFVGYLADRLRCPPAAVIGPDLEQRLLAAGIEAALAGRVARLVERFGALRYGGAARAADAGEARQLVDALEAQFRCGGRR